MTATQEGDANYNAAPPVSYTLSVNKKSLTVASLTATSKEYDATTAATITASTLSGTVGSDAVTLVVGLAPGWVIDAARLASVRMRARA